MSGDRIIAALEELQAERDALLDDVQRLNRETEFAVRQINKLNEAIQSLISLRPELVGGDRHRLLGDDGSSIAFFGTLEKAGEPPSFHYVLGLDPGPDRLEPFINQGGDGRNLQSTQMIATLVDAIAEPVSRDALQHIFFDFYGRDQLLQYWRDPEKSFRTALRRAVERGLVREVSTFGDGESMYMGGLSKGQPAPRAIPPTWGSPD